MVQLWPDKEAKQIIKRHKREDDAPYIFQTGFGPSGKPHFGTFGEVVRTNYVMLAMQDLGHPTKLIAFSDDLDGLRKVPENFPDWLKGEIGKPVSSIPDPFEQYDSYSAHMNALLVQMLEELGLDFEFRSSVESYKAGVFNDQITMVIQNYEAVQDIIFPYLREETQENWFPFFPICENCGSVGHTRVTTVNKDALLLGYKCDREFGGTPGCGHEGEISPLNGTGKLQWKVDWPARWHAFGVHYEMFGKDLIESAEVGDRIMQRIFRSKPPSHMFYELFLDEDARKISKSKGRGMDAERWMRYGTSESLMYLMLDKPREAKRLYDGVIPRYVDLSMKAAEAYHDGQENRDARHYQFITLFDPPTEAPLTVDFSTLANLVGNVGISDPIIIEDYLHRSGLIASISDEQRQQLAGLVAKAQRFYDEQMSLDLEAPKLDAEDGFLLAEFVNFLEADEYDGDRIHNEIFETAKRNNVAPKKFFRALYNALIKQERGPRGGQFIKLMGEATAAKLIRERVAETVAIAAQQATEDKANTPMFLPVSIDKQVAEQYPDLHLAAAIIEGADIQDKRSDKLEKAIAEAVQAVSELELDTAIETGAIGAYRQLFQSFGTNPNGMPPSAEAMLRLAIYDKRLPSVNTLVDAANLTVLETGLSCAVYDLDQIDEWLTLRFAEQDEKHLPIGARQIDSVPNGELIYADMSEVICRALNHRDADKTKITNKTERVLLIVDGSPQIEIDALHTALEKHLERILDFCGGSVAAKGIIL